MQALFLKGTRTFGGSGISVGESRADFLVRLICMNRFDIIAGVGQRSSFVAFGVWLLLGFGSALAAPRPNVLLICVDDLRPVLGCYGDKAVKSPNIDRLAKRGVLFERAYCNQAVCAPSRNALMTSVRPTRSGIYDLSTNFRAAHSNAVTLPQYFMRHGYRAEALGKIFHVGHGNHEDAASWSVPHFQERSIAYVLPESRAPEGLTREEAFFSNITDVAKLPRGAAYESADVGDSEYPDGRIADEAIRRLQSAKARPEQPFFLAVGFLKPHLPFCAPQKYWDLYKRSQFRVPKRQTAPDGVPKYAPTGWGELRQYKDMPESGPVTEAQALALIHGYHATISFMDAPAASSMNSIACNWGRIPSSSFGAITAGISAITVGGANTRIMNKPHASRLSSLRRESRSRAHARAMVWWRLSIFIPRSRNWLVCLSPMCRRESTVAVLSRPCATSTRV